MSQRALAAEARIPQSTVARIESGAVTPRADLLERVLRAAGRSLATEPRLGIGVDRSLIHSVLRLTPAERIRRLSSEERGFRMLQQAVKRAR
jgi:transcriptional regulator with XRE-family HTH domain